MANRNVVGKVMIVLEIPDEGIFHPAPPGYPNIDRPKGSVDIINEIIQQGASATGWISNGIKIPGGHTMPIITLVYEGGV